ncbi:Ku protein, partial [Pseudomonas sp. TH10]|nr:Ku protein [Pseudomonas sp. TH10]
VETATGEEERKTADVIDLTELLKRSLGGKAATKPAAKTKSAAKAAPAKKATKRSAG